MQKKLISVSIDGLLGPKVLDDVPLFLSTQAKSAALNKFQSFKKNPQNYFSSTYRQTSPQLIQIETAAQQKRQTFSNLVVLGIGGSALGAQTLVSALGWKMPKKERPEVFFLDNLDPILISEIFEDLDPIKTLICVVSKSGTTLETLAPLGPIWNWIKNADTTRPSNHFVVITDPKVGPLRKWAQDEKILSFEVPADLGGRFSAFSPVCLFPAAFAGINIHTLVEGASNFFNDSQFLEETLNPMAARLFELEKGGFRAHSLWAYSSFLKNFSSWFVQLWGESLGKRNFEKNRVGLIPCPGVGATDQHSFLQRMAEGRNDIVSGFVKIQNWPEVKSGIGNSALLPMDFKALSGVRGQSFGKILNTEALATEISLQELGRPTYSATLNSLDEASVGALLAFYMDFTVVSGIYLGVNPFDQPGVERAKALFFEHL